MVSGGTDNHLILLNLTDKGMTGKELEHMLDDVHITVNKNAIPFDTQKPFVTSGIRIGTPAMTSRGMKEGEARKIAQLITKVINEKEACYDYVKQEVAKLCAAFPLYADCVR
jgi:glycine hydroxymethyltransferase